MIIKTTALVVSNELVAENIYRMEILAPEISQNAKPGQFINIKVSENFDPLLPRPFSIYNAIEDKIQIIFNAIGKGTKILSTFKAGASINIIGPLGNGFNTTDEFDTAIIVAGGLGIAPFPFLTKILKEKNKKIITFIGAKTKHQLVTDGLENIKIATDDGSLGYKGTIIEFLKSNITNTDLTSFLSTFKIFGCGPNPMLKALVNLCNELNLNCEISVETQMACGTGLCRGCAVRSKGGIYKLACKDGPVFNSNEIVL
ncbi:MAG: dihydroorotate dehydrogenase electron transfer subunit [Candidatus Kryptonium sp.]|nr:dihydroorotate dehydrogenase electron transfer subunit [Candidatus Kryptonium sp.]MCX7762337.1 dihydroorotate dehydrogenase electron transfer subunit [Candidatus Kryptonium sp.]MDW8109059.1 dihydroorotate dehydrogenase electron transfer subunit [Candidatus Kryptonium sp.]